MSRWLQSVNSLLENLDGQAETVAETVADGAQGAGFGKLLQTGRQAVSERLQQQLEEDDDEFYDDEEEEFDEEYDSDEEEEAEDVNGYAVEEEEEDLNDEAPAEQRAQSPDDALGAPSDNEEAVDVAVRRKSQRDDATVSDISFSDYSEDGDGEIHREKRKSRDHKGKPVKKDINADEEQLVPGVGNGGTADTPPETLNRGSEKYPSSTSREPTATSPLQSAHASIAAATTGTKSSNATIPQDSQKSKGSTLTHKRLGAPASKSLSPRIDESPRQPRRSIDSRQMLSADLKLLEEDLLAEEDKKALIDTAAMTTGSNHSGSAKAQLHGRVPPKPPARKASFPNKPKSEPVDVAIVNAVAGDNPMEGSRQRPAPPPRQATSAPTTRTTPPPPPPISPKQNINAITSTTNESKAKRHVRPPPTSNPTSSKEYVRLKEKFQSLQTKHSQISNEFKTGQSEIKSLQAQVQALNAKLDAANSEIHAQADELRRTGDRMEKERLRGVEEREDLLDEQEDELEQLKSGHQKEMDSLRLEYERQIADISGQLEDEEHRRRQEGGDYTQELQDAIERERDALKRLNEESMTKSQLETQVSHLQTHQAALQSKLETAIQSGKTASDREREAQDKLDATLSLHARQMAQRQTREADLEKTIFDLGAALTVAQQKANQAHLSGGRGSGTAKGTSQQSSGKGADSSSYKDQYLAAAEELESLKVQFEMETQRRQALQEEFNDMSKERTAEIANSQARQQQHDRTVADLEAAVSRLKGSIRDQKDRERQAVSDTETNGISSAVLSQDLRVAKQEIKGLSSQLLRQQGVTEQSKSEILALKGRLQAATTRAEHAERSLQAEQAARFTSELGSSNGGRSAATGMRRRVKGATAARNRTRTIRSALQMSPGRTHHPFMEQVATTLDALDAWMVDTGSFMKYEPLARLGFMMYLMLLHLWCFALIVFHTTEQPHGDFGSMDNDPRHWRAAVAAVQQQAQEDSLHH